jgi:hypothetical protein
VQRFGARRRRVELRQRVGEPVELVQRVGAQEGERRSGGGGLPARELERLEELQGSESESEMCERRESKVPSRFHDRFAEAPITHLARVQGSRDSRLHVVNQLG